MSNSEHLDNSEPVENEAPVSDRGNKSEGHIEKPRAYNNALENLKLERQQERERNDNLEKQIKALMKQNEKNESEILSFKIKDSKASAFAKAKASMGEGFSIPDEAKLLAQINKLSYNAETLDADIQDLVDLAKREAPKTNQSFPVFGQPEKAEVSSVQKDAFKMTEKELRELRNTNPEEFQRVMKVKSLFVKQ